MKKNNFFFFLVESLFRRWPRWNWWCNSSFRCTTSKEIWSGLSSFCLCRFFFSCFSILFLSFFCSFLLFVFFQLFRFFLCFFLSFLIFSFIFLFSFALFFFLLLVSYFKKGNINHFSVKNRTQNIFCKWKNFISLDICCACHGYDSFAC